MVKKMKNETIHVTFNFFTIHQFFASNILPRFLYKTEGKVPILFYFLIKKEITFSPSFIQEPMGIVTQPTYNESMSYIHKVTTLKILPTHQSIHKKPYAYNKNANTTTIYL